MIYHGAGGTTIAGTRYSPPPLQRGQAGQITLVHRLHNDLRDGVVQPARDHRRHDHGVHSFVPVDDDAFFDLFAFFAFVAFVAFFDFVAANVGLCGQHGVADIDHDVLCRYPLFLLLPGLPRVCRAGPVVVGQHHPDGKHGREVKPFGDSNQ